MSLTSPKSVFLPSEQFKPFTTLWWHALTNGKGVERALAMLATPIRFAAERATCALISEKSATLGNCFRTIPKCLEMGTEPGVRMIEYLHDCTCVARPIGCSSIFLSKRNSSEGNRMTTQQTVEHVLVVPTLLFHEVGHFQGFTTNTKPYLDILLDPSYISYRPRPEVEEDPSFKQLIPYCIFRHQGQIFNYMRGDKSGEARLHAKRSIGIGGHISAEDQNTGTSVYRVGMQREIEEEVYLESEFTESCVALINDDETEVGRVHLGIVHLFDLDNPKVRPREKSIIQAGFEQPAQLIKDRDQFETWSQICFEFLSTID